jgi:hypothetical protein
MEEALPYVTYCSQEFKEKRKESAFFIEIAKALTSRAFDNRDKIEVHGAGCKVWIGTNRVSRVPCTVNLESVCTSPHPGSSGVHAYRGRGKRNS